MGRKRLLPGLTVKDGYMRHPFDTAYGVETSGLVLGQHLTTGHAHDKHSTAYYGIAPSVLEGLVARWRTTALVAPPEDYSFLDIGAGMGRGLLIASRMPFREVIGIELHPDLAARAQKNLDLWQDAGRARCPMRMVCADVTEFDFPRFPCVAYLFNPFREPVLKKLLRHLEKQFARRPGQLDLLYANDECVEVLQGNSRWRQVWRGLVPLSPEDEAADKAILNHQPNGEYAWSTEEPCSVWRFIGANFYSMRPK
jgi:SAM-dependent methyltransferase